MIKKFLIILIIGNLFLTTWFFRDFFKNLIFQSQETVIDLEKQKKGDISNTKTENQKEKDYIIASGEIKTVNWNKDNNLIYYNQNNFLETDFSGSYKKTLSSYPFKNLKTIQCSDSRKFCLVWAEGFSIYNLETKENNKLPDQTIDASLNYQGDGLIYLLKSNNQTYQLITSDLSIENKILLDTINGENLKIVVNPKNNKIIYYSKSKKDGIFLTDIVDIDKKEKLNEEFIIDANWSPDGQKILFSFYDYTNSNKRVQLGYYDLKQKKQFNLGLPGISQKCAWEKDSLALYCGILANTEPQEFVLDDWYSRKFISQDFFWRIDLLMNERKRLFDDPKKYPIVDSFNLFIEGKELFFVDKISGNLIKREL